MEQEPITDDYVRHEFDRVLHAADALWFTHDPRLVADPPKLKIQRFDRIVRKLGHATYDGREVKINLGTNVDRYDVQEILAHEVTHVAMDRALIIGSPHSPRFWTRLDRLFRDVHGEDLVVRSRTDIHHGRYADAVRRRDLLANTAAFDAVIMDALQPREPLELRGSTWDDVSTALQDGRSILLPNGEVRSTLKIYEYDQIASRDAQGDWMPFVDRNEEDLDDPAVVARIAREAAFINGDPPPEYDRPEVIGWNHMPQPLTGATESETLKGWLPDDVLRNAGVRTPADETPRRRRTRTATAELDERVYDIIAAHPGKDRWMVDWYYRETHGDYPGASTYNSIWRLRRDGRVWRDGNRWYPTTR